MKDHAAIVNEWVCLHKQVTERVRCGHVPRHVDHADALIQGRGPCSGELAKVVRAAAERRRRTPYGRG